MQRLREMLAVVEQTNAAFVRSQERARRVRELIEELREELRGPGAVEVADDVLDRIKRPTGKLNKNRAVLRNKVSAGQSIAEKIIPAGRKTSTPPELKMLLTRMRAIAERNEKEYEGLAGVLEEQVAAARKRGSSPISVKG